MIRSATRTTCAPRASLSALNRWVPNLTLIVAGAHAVTAFAQYRDVYRKMLAGGIIGSVNGQHDREAATWFFVAAPATAALGLVSRWGVERTGEIPPAVPPTLLSLGALIAALSPASGGWVLIALGIAGFAAGRSPTVAQASHPIDPSLLALSEPVGRAGPPHPSR